MKTAISHLPLEKQEELTEITEFAISSYPLEMIILFGSYARGNWVEDKYIENGTTYEYKSDYDLLFVVKNEQKAKYSSHNRKLRRKISQNTDIETPINIIYHGIDYLNAEIEEGNYFFTDILKEGILLYDSKKYALSAPKALSSKDRFRKKQLYFDKWFENANEFLIDFENAYKRSSYNQAAFLLHQATERYFMTLLLVFTDYKPKIHDLEELHRQAGKIDARFKPVFPKQTKEEISLFELLRKAYIDSRYKMGYEIKKDELEYLSGKVNFLQELTKEICNEKLKQLEEG